MEGAMNVHGGCEEHDGGAYERYRAGDGNLPEINNEGGFRRFEVWG